MMDEESPSSLSSSSSSSRAHQRRWSFEALGNLASGFGFINFKPPKWKIRQHRRSSYAAEHVLFHRNVDHSIFHGKWPRPSFMSRAPSLSRLRSTSRSRSRHQVIYAIVTLNTGETKLVSSDEGSRLGEEILQANMSEKRISSYRLIMTSTRAILSEDSVGSCPSVGLESALEDVFEESDCSESFLDHQGILTELDNRIEIVQEMLTTEKTFFNNLNSILKLYAEPLRKFSSLTVADHRVLFVGIEPILSISAMLTSKLEDVLKSWDPASSQIGNLFPSKFWNHFEEYCTNYSQTKRLIEKLKSDNSFVEFCELRKGKSTYCLEDLVHQPVQRIPDYDKYLNDLLDETDTGHPDYDDLSRAALRVHKIVREHEEEFGTSPENLRMDSIQKRFPNDDLQLRESPSASQKLRHLSTRRRSAPGAVLFKTLGNRSKSAGNLLSQSVMGKRDMDIVNPLRRQDSINRQYLMEGQVEFMKSVQVHDRYLFLFNDLLLVAKQKTSTTYKLKNRVRICEMWISECISDVAELPRPADRSFVIGWPTTNVVATFKSVECKDLWMNKLAEQIEEEHEKESHFTAMKLKVVCREMEQACTIDIDSKMEAREVLKKCTNQFQIPESEIGDYQLCVKSGREDTPYPLIGHELPFNIKMSHVRDICQSRPDDLIIPADYDRVLEEAPQDLKCQFVLKHSKKSPKKSYDENTGKLKKTKKSPLMNFFRRHKDDKNNNFTPPGKLFGHPLEDVTTDVGLPKSVMEMFKILFRDGPHTTGIFRKSANAKKQKELKQKLDEEEVFMDDGEYAPLVIGAVLKEYLRSLPHCLLLEDYYDQWICLNEEEETPQKQAQVKQLLYKLPIYHFDLLRHLMCVLHYINKNSAENLMTAYNLAVCIAPSILWSKHNDPLKALATTNNSQNIVAYLIEHCVDIFGEETLLLLGEPCDSKLRQDSSTDSDSMHSVLSMPDSSSGGTNRRDDSSIDSLEREVYIGDMDSSPNLAKSHLSPSNLSRDSGLMMSDGQLNEDDNSSVEMLDSSRKSTYPRSVSQYMDSDKSYDSLYSYESQNPKPPPRKNKRKENNQSPSLDTQRHHIIYSRTSNRHVDNNRPMLTQSLSVDAFSRFESSTESLKSIDENVTNENFSDWKRKPFDSPMIHKSVSGKHLYIEDTTSNIVKEIDMRSNLDKFTRQQSGTDSTPPMSPQSKYSYMSESMDSVLSDSSGSAFLSRQYSRETDFSEKSGSWVSAEDSSEFHHLQKSHDDSSIDLDTSSSSLSQKNSVPKSLQNTRFLVSPNSSPGSARRNTYQNSSHQNVGARRSFPLLEETVAKGSGGSTTSKEAEDIITSPKVPQFYLNTSGDMSPQPRSSEHSFSTLPHKNSQSTTALDSYNSNMPIKQITKYSTGLGSSPPPHIIMHRNQRAPQKRDNHPVRASYDSAIVSQVRKNSADSGNELRRQHSESFHHDSPSCKSQPQRGDSPHSLSRSESDSEINRTLTNSPDKARPDQPPCYDQAMQRKFMIHMGLPLQISEEDEIKQKEASALAKKLYENSLKSYMEDHLNSPSVQKYLPPTSPHQETVISAEVISESEDSDNEEGNMEENCVSKNPKQLYEASRRAYEQSMMGERKLTHTQSGKSSPVAENKNLAVPMCNLHRSFSDSAEHIHKLGPWSQRSPRRGNSPLAQERVPTDIRHQRGNSPINSNTRLSYSSSSVSNSSSDTVTDSQGPANYNSRDRSESSPVISRHAFPKADSPVLSKHAQLSSARNNRDSINEARSHYFDERSRSLSRESSFDSKHSSKDVSTISIPRRLSNELAKVQITKRETPENQLSESMNVSRDRSLDSLKTQKSQRDLSKSFDASHFSNTKSRNQTVKKDSYMKPMRELPWSVKELRSMWDHKGDSGDSDNRNNNQFRPPPPPYQNPPPFRRLVDNTRVSTSSNSSTGSTKSGRNTPPQRPHSVHGNLRGGPQRGESFSSAEDSDTGSRYSGHTTSSSSSEELSQWSRTYITDVSYV